MNHKKILDNLTFSVQLPYITGQSLLNLCVFVEYTYMCVCKLGEPCLYLAVLSSYCTHLTLYAAKYKASGFR